MAGEFLQFPGVDHPVGLNGARTHGVFPNQIMLWCLPQAGNIPASGTLSFGGSNGNISMQMYVDRPNYKYSVVGHKIGIILQDRRVLWKFGRITGRYNVPRSDGTLINEKTPRELASLLWAEMGESGADVSALPTVGRPEVFWDADRADLQLAKLCDLYGCEPTLLLNDVAGVVRLSTGASLPTSGPIQSIAITVDPPQRPASLRLVCGATKFQFRMLCEPVALDTNGHITTPEEVSYAPPDGFSADPDWDQFPTVETEEGRYFASLSVGRWYRIKAFADDTLDVPEFGFTLDSINQILPIDPDLIDVSITSGISRQAQPEVIARYFVEGSPGVFDNTEDPERVSIPFTIVPELGLFKFQSPIRVREDDNTWGFADVFVTVAFSIEHSDTLIDLRQEYTTAAGGPFGEDVIRERSLFRMYVGRYDANTDTTPTSIDDNESSVLSSATGILTDALARYVTTQAGITRLVGIFPINPDGVIRQVAWDIQTGENGGWFTTASANTESIPYVPRLADRRQWRLSREKDGEPGPAERNRRLKTRGIRP